MQALRGHIIGTLDLGPYVDGRTWIVDNALRQFGYELADGRRVIPAHGFRTDFASVPKPLRWLLPPAGDGPGAAYGPAAVLHDDLYQCGEIDGVPISRELADLVFLWAMEDLDVATWRRVVLYRGVQLGGYWTWRRYRSRDRRRQNAEVRC